MGTQSATDRQAEIGQLVTYSVTDAEIAKLRASYANIRFDEPAAYEEGRKAIATLRGLRSAVEARRKQLKQESLDFGRLVDGAAKKLTAAIEEIELPLKALKDRVDQTKEDAERAAADEAARLAREAEDARLADERAKLAAETAAFEARRKAADAERLHREAEEKAERDRVASEQRAAQAKIDAERAEVEAKERAIREREEAAARAEAERQAAIQAEREAAEQAQRDRVAAAEVEAAEVARVAAEQARLDALRPDVERVLAFAGELRELAGRAPTVESDEARAAVEWVCSRLDTIAGQVVTRFAPAAVT